MKNQYFGDKNDFFKYDLVLSLIEKVEALRNFTFIPMLTRNDERRDGGLTVYSGSSRKHLYDFLQRCIKNDQRDIRQLKSLLNKNGEVPRDYLLYCEDTYFEDYSRRKYFSKIPQPSLEESVILVDPDNGFEVKSTRRGNRHKYFLYNELQSLYARMIPSSVLLIYQHIPRVKRRPYFDRIGTKIREHTQTGPICITNNMIAFFAMAKTDALSDEIWITAKDFARTRNLFAYELRKQDRTKEGSTLG